MEQSQNLELVRDRASTFATKFNHKQIAPSHFLLAIIKTPECQACQLLIASKVPISKLGEIIVGKRFNQEEAGTPTGIPTAASKACFTQASEIAMQSGTSQLRTEHLLIGLLADPTLSCAPIRIVHPALAVPMRVSAARRHHSPLVSREPSYSANPLALRHLIPICAPCQSAWHSSGITALVPLIEI